jgi:tetratricopeptide (TPR) repeat protein
MLTVSGGPLRMGSSFDALSSATIFVRGCDSGAQRKMHGRLKTSASEKSFKAYRRFFIDSSRLFSDRDELSTFVPFVPSCPQFPPPCYLHSCANVPDNERGYSTVYRYSRADLLRILRVTQRQLNAWEKAGLVAGAEDYSFFDLLQVKKVRDLCAKRVRPAVIRQSLEAMQKQVAGMENPLLEAGAYQSGHRVAFRHAGRLLEPIAGQFMFDFAGNDKVVTSPPPVGPELVITNVAELFAKGVTLEEDPARQTEALLVYQKVLDMDPNHAAAHINLGTLYYNRQDYAQAEKHYRSAIAIDPRYALAYFDLGNVLDETGRVEEAIATYKAAIQLAPTYADAHYNLALAYEKIREPRKALTHWRTYVRLDTVGPWSVHARHQIQRILQSDRLKLVFNRKTS